MRFFLVKILMAFGILAGSPSSAITYNIDLSVPCVDGCTGAIDITGTIEIPVLGTITDGSTIGDISLLFSSQNYPSVPVSSPAASLSIEGGWSLLATPTQLIVNFTPNNGEVIFGDFMGGPPAAFVQFTRQSPSSVTLQATIVDSGPPDIAEIVDLGEPPEFVIGTNKVPLPGALPLMLGGFAVFGAFAVVKRR